LNSSELECSQRKYIGTPGRISIKFHLIRRAEFIKYRDKVARSLYVDERFDFRFVCACGGPWFCGAALCNNRCNRECTFFSLLCGHVCVHRFGGFNRRALHTLSQNFTVPRHAAPWHTTDTIHAAYLLSDATTPERHRLFRRQKKSLTSQLLPRRKSFVSFALS